MKDVKDIRDEFFDEGKLSTQSIKDLIWHIENDPSPDRSISLVTDAYLTDGSLVELIPLIAKHLNNDDDFIREITVSCVVSRIGLPEYAETALQMAKEDQDDGPRSLATSSLGTVINKVDPILKKQIACYLYDVILSNEYKNSLKRGAFDSILKAMDVPAPQRIATPYDEKHELIELFKIKYGI
jgi:hypothetical protein